MAYTLAKNCGDSTAVPQIIFSRLADVDGDFIRVALYVVATRCTDAVEIQRALRLKSKTAAQRALDYWAGAGLLVQSTVGHSIESAMPVKRTPHMTSHEVSTAAMADPAIACLLQESQRIWGRAVPQADSNILVSLYKNDNIPVDMILMGIAHYGRPNKTARYVESVLLRLQADGIDNGAAMERYLQHENLCAQREVAVAEILQVDGKTFTKSERTLIHAWYDDFAFGDDMVREALGFAGERKTVRYLNGILRNWYSKGYKTVRDVMNANANTMQNIQVTATTMAGGDLMQNDLDRPVVYRKRSEKHE